MLVLEIMKSNGKKVVVTGGAGFIGSHLVDELVGHGFDVHIVDNFSTGKREFVNPASALHEMDIRDFDKLGAVFSGADFVFHLAALPRVQRSIQDPKTTHDVNVNGTFNVLLAARDAQVKRVIYSSSSSVYGNQETFPLHEGLSPRPVSPYALQKYIGETMSVLFSRIYGLKTVSLRYFSVFGPRQPEEGEYTTVIRRFLHQRSLGQALTLVPDGKQSRDFTHVKDVVRANILAMTSEKVGEGEVINIGAGRDKSVEYIATLVGGPTVFTEPRLEPKRTLADISRAKELLGWEPTISLEEGIEELKRLHLV